MCGICGIASDDAPVPAERISTAMRLLAHRGPDDEGRFIGGAGPWFGLGHRRLSIIDLATGHQPMSNEDGTVWVVSNGEIYNYKALRERLAGLGHTFKTASDTEVIVHAYEEWHDDFVDDLIGMFAIALVDLKRGRLVLVRDRLGQKPVYWRLDGGQLVFASELRAISALADVPRRVSVEALSHYLTYQYVPAPMSIFEGVSKLEPATMLVYENGQARLRRYWRADFSHVEEAPFDEYARRLRELVADATELRMVSDAPLGAFLSGGIDSTIVVGLFSRAKRDPVRTFSVGFDYHRFDELDYARQAAAAFGTDHSEFTVRCDSVGLLARLVWHFSEPFADSSAIPTYYVARETRRAVKVALTGDAGDELFAGYPRYRAMRIGEVIDRLPCPLKAVARSPLWAKLPASVRQKTALRRLKRLMSAMPLEPAERYLAWISVFDEMQKRELLSDGLVGQLPDAASREYLIRYFEEPTARGAVAKASCADVNTYLPNDILTKVDITSMAVGLETRSPFLDHRVVELAAAMPTRYKMHRGVQKYILKRAFADVLPGRIARRKKMGFGVPIDEWFRGELAAVLNRVLLSARCLERGYFRAEAVQQLVVDHTSCRADNSYRLWALLFFELWLRMFVDGSAVPANPESVGSDLLE